MIKEEGAGLRVIEDFGAGCGLYSVRESMDFE